MSVTRQRWHAAMALPSMRFLSMRNGGRGSTGADVTDKARLKRLGDGTLIAYASAGGGSPVVCVHGALCDFRYWEPQLRGLADRHEVLAPSLAHYHPPLPDTQLPAFGWRQHAQQVLDFIQACGLDRAHLVGHSRGAAVAWQAAIAQPQRVRSLTLLDPGAPQEAGLPAEAEALRAQALALLDAGEQDAGLACFVDSVSQPGSWKRSSEAFRNMVRDNAATLAPQLADALPPFRQADARALELPVLLLDGALSPAQYRDNAAALSAWLPDARRHTIAGASHGMTFTHPRRCNALIGQFLAEHEG